MNEQIRALVVRHCTTLRAEARDIADAMRMAGPGLRNGRGSLISTIHKLKGSSGTLGFAEVSALAERMERRLRDVADQSISAEDLAMLEACHRDLQISIAEITPEQSALYARFR